MSAEKKKQKNVLVLIVALVAVLVGAVLFVGAASGWFSDGFRVTLDDEYYCKDGCDGEYMELTAEGYEDLIKNEKSFLVFIDQGGCTTADRVREYVADYAEEFGVKAYKMMFEEMKETSLHEYVKYYPSVAVVSRGRVAGYLRADSDEDADAYNNYDAFLEWMNKYIVVEKK